MSFSFYLQSAEHGQCQMLFFVTSQIHTNRALNYCLSEAEAVCFVSKHNVFPPSLVLDLEVLLLTVKLLEFHIKGV